MVLRRVNDSDYAATGRISTLFHLFNGQYDAEGVARESLVPAFGIVAAAGLGEADYTDDQGREPPSRVPAAQSMNPTRGAISPKCAPSGPIRLRQERAANFFAGFGG